MSLMAGRRGLVLGVANERSIAYGVARAAAGQGAQLLLSFQDERLRSRVEPLARELNAVLLGPCDLGRESDLAALVAGVQERGDTLDFLVHAVAFADKDELTGRFVDTSRSAFGVALDVSCYSLVAVARAFEPLLKRSHGGASILTMSYEGARRAVPNYNVMGVAKAALEASVRYLAADLGPSGIRVNALSPGPIKTLSAASIRGLRDMLEHVEQTSPLRRNVTIDDVGAMAVALLSGLSAGVTGEVIHVDSGHHAVLALAHAERARQTREGGS